LTKIDFSTKIKRTIMTDKNTNVRTRFAPSPTGPLHIGNVRTALYSYLFAKKHNGKFILRIEDTDKERSKPEFETDILDGLKWLGLNWDEGPGALGEYGPYRQSERNEIYKKLTQELIDKGSAYYCFCSKEELDAKRNFQIEQGSPQIYDGKCSTLSLEEAKRRVANGEKHVIRLKMPKEKISFKDLIREHIEFDGSLIGDVVIAKDLQTPLYNLACAIDDCLMKITHVVRGEDHIPNTPIQGIINKALGFPEVIYAHLPMILGPDKSKLSKRHNAEPVNFYKQAGYLPEAVDNFMAFLGWNPGDEREMFTLQELEHEFSIERCRPSGAIFNVQKLNWYNSEYIKKMDNKELAQLIVPFLASANWTGDIDYLTKAVAPYRERMTTLKEFFELADFFFKDLTYDKEVFFWKDLTDGKIKDALSDSLNVLKNISNQDWNKEILEKNILDFIATNQDKYANRGYLLWPLRVALTGKKASCGPFEAAEVLGQEKSIERITKAINLF